jgi:hypothetical protein
MDVLVVIAVGLVLTRKIGRDEFLTLLLLALIYTHEWSFGVGLLFVQVEHLLHLGDEAGLLARWQTPLLS